MGVIERSAFDNSWHVLTNYSYKNCKEIIRWCLDNIELNKGDCQLYGKFAWSVEYLGKKGTNFTFGREKDAALFALRWL